MESGTLTDMSFHAALSALDWQVELGADEAICEAPVNRYELASEAPAIAVDRKRRGAEPAPPGAHPAQPVRPAAAMPPPVAAPEVDVVAVARRMAEGAKDLGQLREAMEAYDHCELKRGARQLVFADGIPGAKLMIIGEAPGREEDREGKPFVGRAGQLLDRMLAAIGLSRKDEAAPVYITNVIPWRPPQNRDPKPEEIAMMRPFLERHVALANPDVLILMGNISCQAVLGRRGITRLRGGWVEAFGRPAMPMFHPAYLLRTPHAKRETWADLLSVKARLERGR